VTLFDLDSRPADNTRRRWKLIVAYDGSNFHGFAAQSDVRTVQGELTAALAQTLNIGLEDLRFSCAGRTDAGVHAWGQVVAIDVPTSADPERIIRSVNRLIGPEIAVRSIDEVDYEFDARHNARSRLYRYTILNRATPDPFMAAHSWRIDKPLERNLLSLAADPFVGEHDFSAFCRKNPDGVSNVRRVDRSRWIFDPKSDVLVYEIKANAFCWQMVRSIVGTLVACGSGRLRPGDILGVLNSRDRNQAEPIAPPAGLCLWEVDY